MNVMFLIGNVGREPEIRTTNSGSKVASFSIATSERWKDKEGERQEKTTWHNCIAWGPLTTVVEGYVRKGSKVAVLGRMEARKFTTKEGDERTAHECVVQTLELLSPKKDHARDDSEEEEKPRRRRPAMIGAKPDGDYDLDNLDDDIPF
jgi:single-strand DNA-binding protein